MGGHEDWAIFMEVIHVSSLRLRVDTVTLKEETPSKRMLHVESFWLFTYKMVI